MSWSQRKSDPCLQWSLESPNPINSFRKSQTKGHQVRFVRRGRSSHRKKDIDDDVPSDWEELQSAVENKEELREWLTTQRCKTTLLPHNQLIKKYLPPGTIMGLFEHYRATQQMLGRQSVSYPSLIHKFCVLGFRVVKNLRAKIEVKGATRILVAPITLCPVNWRTALNAEGMERSSMSSRDDGRTFLPLGRRACSVRAKFAAY